MNILVTGANGQLGNEMRILAAGSADCYLFTDVCEASSEAVALLRQQAGDAVDVTTHMLDITNASAVRAMVADHQIQAIVNCAAYTNVEAAESNEPLAERLNADAPRILAEAMKEVEGLLIHISTDYVFGQEPYNIPCREDQTGTPTGVYGLTKLHGEQAIQQVFNGNPSSCKGSTRGAFVIIRTAWLYSEFGKNFVKTMLRLTAEKPQLKVVFDQAGTPTYAFDLATAIETILADYQRECLSSINNPLDYSKSGIYHFSDEGVCSWYDFTKMIQEYAGQTTCEVLPCHSTEFPSSVIRPSYSVLDKTKIKETFVMDIPYWTDSLRRCLSALHCLS